MCQNCIRKVIYFVYCVQLASTQTFIDLRRALAELRRRRLIMGCRIIIYNYCYQRGIVNFFILIVKVKRVKIFTKWLINIYYMGHSVYKKTMKLIIHRYRQYLNKKMRFCDFCAI